MEQQLVTIENEMPLTTSYIIAEQVGTTHKSTMQLIKDKQEVIEKHFGVLRFENDKPLPCSTGGRPEQFAKLTEGQTYFILTLTRNTEKSEEVKALFVKAFMEAKEQIVTLKQFQPSADLLAQFEQDVTQHPEQLQEAIQLANARLRYLKLLQKAKRSDSLVSTSMVPTKALTQIGQLGEPHQRIAAEDEHTQLTNRVLAFMSKAQEPVSRRTIRWRSHIANVHLEPILDELVTSGQVSRIKIPGSRVQWFYQVSGNDDLPARHAQGLDT